MKKALILIHGYLVGPDDWDKLLKDINQLEYDGIFPLTLAGHARGDEQEKLDYTKFTASNCISKVTNEVEEIMQSYATVDIIGHSLGGIIALYLASKFDMHRVAVLAPAYDIIPINWLTTWQAKKRAEKWTKHARKLADYDHYEHIKFIEAYDDYRKSTDVVIERTGQYVTEQSLKTLTDIIKITRQCDYSAINCPVLAIWGGFDEAVPKKAIKILARKFKGNANYKSEVLELFGHNFMWSKDAKYINKHITDFLLNI